MTIIYQGKKTETSATTVAEFLEKEAGAWRSVVEYNGDVLAGETALDVPLSDGAVLNAYRIVSGG